MGLGILIVIFCFFTLTTNAALPEKISGREHAEAMLLLSHSNFNVRLGAKSVSRKESASQFVLDLLAEVTWKACSGKRKLNSDALSWLGKTIGNTKQMRYATLLDYCINSSKSTSYIEAARDKLEGTSTNVFEGGKISLEKLHARLKNNDGNTKSEKLIKLFSELLGGTTLDNVYMKLGSPSGGVSGFSSPQGRVGRGFVKVTISEDLVVLTYINLGKVSFNYDKIESDWLLSYATSVNGLHWNKRDGSFVQLSTLVETNDGKKLRQFAKELYKRNDIETTTLDSIAEKVYRSRHESENQLPDALAWLCNVIGKSGNGRYRQIMLDVANSADTTNKLRKFAKKAANNLPDGSTEIFISSMHE